MSGERIIDFEKAKEEKRIRDEKKGKVKAIINEDELKERIRFNESINKKLKDRQELAGKIGEYFPGSLEELENYGNCGGEDIVNRGGWSEEIKQRNGDKGKIDNNRSDEEVITVMTKKEMNKKAMDEVMEDFKNLK